MKRLKKTATVLIIALAAFALFSIAFPARDRRIARLLREASTFGGDREAALDALSRITDERDIEVLIGVLSHRETARREAAAAALVRIGEPAAGQVTRQLVLDRMDEERLARWNRPDVFGNNTWRRLDLERFIVPEIGRPCVAPIAEMLENEETARAASEALPLVATEEDIPLLLRLLGGDYRLCEEAALSALDGLDCREVPDSLTELVGPVNARFRVACILAHMGDARALPALLEQLQSPQTWDLHCRAIGLAARLRDERIAGFLVKALSDQTDHVRLAATVALWRMGGRSAVPALQKLITDPDERVRNAAKAALNWIEGVPGAVSYADADGTALPSRVQSRGADDATFERDIADLGSRDANRRVQALYRIPENGDTRYVEALLRLLDDPVGHVRGQAASVVSRFDDPRVTGALLRKLHDPSTWVRGNAAQSLAGRMDEDVREALLGMLRDADRNVREGAAKALLSTWDDIDVLVVERALRDNGWSGRQALGEFYGRKARDALERCPWEPSSGRNPEGEDDEAGSEE